MNEITWAVSAHVGCPSAVYMQNMSAAGLRRVSAPPLLPPALLQSQAKGQGFWSCDSTDDVSLKSSQLFQPLYFFFIYFFFRSCSLSTPVEAEEHGIRMSGSDRAGGTLRSVFQQVGRPSSEDARQFLSKKFVIDFSFRLVIGLI